MDCIKNKSKSFYYLIPIILLIATAEMRCQKAETYDPVTMDLEMVDRDYPAQLVEQPEGLVSHGKRLNGIIYLAQGKGPHPTVLLLHGLPGNERNLDLAQALRRAGWNVVFFHYRGAWGSEGDFRPTHSLEDVHQVLRFIRGEKAREAYRIDGERIVLIGHSYGGAMAALAAAQDSAVRAVVSIAGANLYAVMQMQSEDEQSGAEAYLENNLSLNVPSGRIFQSDVEENRRLFNTLNHVDALAARSILLIHGARDEALPKHCHSEPLAQALQEAGAEDCLYVEMDADHAFSDKRIALTHCIIDWLDERFQ